MEEHCVGYEIDTGMATVHSMLVEIPMRLLRTGFQFTCLDTTV